MSSKYPIDDIYEYIEEQIEEEGAPPTTREIGEEFGISSTAQVRYILNKLADSGLIKLIPRVSRGIRLVRGGDEDAE